MKRNTWWARLLRIIGIVLMSFAAAFTLLGGIGTTCVALNPTGFGGSFAAIAPYQGLWLLFVLVGIAVGVMGIRAVTLLVKGKKNAYSYSLTALILGIAINALHMFVSRALRGSSMPVDAVLYTNLLTLLFFLLIHLPGIWAGVDFQKTSMENHKSGQAAAIITCGLLSLTIQWLVAPSHTMNGNNYADVWHIVLTTIGLILIVSGIVTVLLSGLTCSRDNSLPDTGE